MTKIADKELQQQKEVDILLKKYNELAIKTASIEFDDFTSYKKSLDKTVDAYIPLYHRGIKPTVDWAPKDMKKLLRLLRKDLPNITEEEWQDFLEKNELTKYNQ